MSERKYRWSFGQGNYFVSEMHDGSIDWSSQPFIQEMAREILNLSAKLAHVEAQASAAREVIRKLSAAFDVSRDDILHERGPLEGSPINADDINSVLDILDSEFSEALALAAPYLEEKGKTT